MVTDGPIYGIKLVTPDHFKYQPFEADFEHDAERCTLMNFKDSAQGRAAARKLVPGSRAILYVSGEQWFARAFEVTGTVSDGERIARAFNTPALDMFAAANPYRIYRPIRWLARVEPNEREDPMEVCARAGVAFSPNAFTFKRLDKGEYDRLYAAIRWSWTRAAIRPPTPMPPHAQTEAHGAGQTHAHRSPTKEPWYPRIVNRIRRVSPLPERNHEDVISDLLKHLGVHPDRIVFQHGRIDITVAAEGGRVGVVIEVKQDLNMTAQIARAREQVHTYGRRVGCDHCVMTDGDLWELHDLGRGERYDQRYLGAFRLTDFHEHDAALFDVLCGWLGV